MLAIALFVSTTSLSQTLDTIENRVPYYWYTNSEWYDSTECFSHGAIYRFDHELVYDDDINFVSINYYDNPLLGEEIYLYGRWANTGR